MQVAVQTQREVRGLSKTARKAEYAAQITASKVERQAEDIARQMKEQKEQAMLEAKVAQERMAPQLHEAQTAVQSTVNLSQAYEKQLDAVTKKMAKMEKLLMTQTQRSTTLEGQLSAAQDRICGRLPGVVGPLTPVGLQLNTLAMKCVRAVLSRTQTPLTAYETLRVRIFFTVQSGILQR